MTTQTSQKNPRLLVISTAMISIPAIIAMFFLQLGINEVSNQTFYFSIAGLFGIVALAFAAIFARRHKKIQVNK